MNMKIEKNQENNAIETFHFEMINEDTCMKNWHFDIMGNDGEAIVLDSNIEFTKQGCNGHPKTISALIKGRRLSEIDTEALKGTTCFRGQSCGMSLAVCVEAMRG